MTPLANASPDVNKMAAMALGVVFLLLGVLGFVNDPILNLFEVNPLHNVVHLLSGAALLGVALVQGGRNSRVALFAFAGVYALVTMIGFARPAFVTDTLGIDLNLNDNWLHLVLAAILLAIPLLFKDDAPRDATF